MDLTTPAATLMPPLRARVLMVLARTEMGLTGRRLAVLAGGSVAGVAKILDSLVAGGLVYRLDAGSAFLYTLNRRHLAAPVVEALAGMRGELVQRMRRSLSEFTHRPAAAVLFGSAARGDGSPESDVDLLLVRPDGVDPDDEDWVGDVARLGESVLAWTGNALNTVEYSVTEVGAARRAGLLDRVESEGLPLSGTTLRTLRRRAAG